MKKTKTIKLTDEYMLRQLIKQANGFGARLRLYRPKNKKYDFCISGSDIVQRRIKMGGTADWLYGELLKNFTDCFENLCG